MDRRAFGQRGEKIAAEYLTARHFLILERNFYSPFGEIDIIARDGEVIVFVEVKSSRTTTFGHPAGWINRRKQKRLALTAQYYLQKTGKNNFCRFDAVIIKYVNNKPQITYYKEAFVPDDEQ